MTTVDTVTGITLQLQAHANNLNDMARAAQLDLVTENDAGHMASAVFENVLALARTLGDDAGAALLAQFRARIVPSVIRAWDPWILEAWDAPEPPVCHWIGHPFPDGLPFPDVPFPV